MATGANGAGERAAALGARGRGEGDGVVIELRRGKIGEEDCVVESRISEADRLICGRRPAHLGCGIGDALKGSDGGNFSGVRSGDKCDGRGHIGPSSVCEEHGVGVRAEGQADVLNTLIERGGDGV